MLKILITFFIISFFSACSFAETTPFIMGYDQIMPASFFGLNENQKIGHLFQNPALIAPIKSQQIKFNTSPSYYGYNFLSFGYIFSYTNFVIGLGYQSLSANDIKYTTQIGTARPSILEYSTHENSIIKLAAAYPILVNTYLGASLNNFSQKIVSATYQALYGDIGIYYNYENFIYLGCYSMYYFNLPSSFHTDTELNLEKTICFEGYLKEKGFHLGYQFNNEHKLFAAADLTSAFNISMQGLFTDKIKLKSFTIGTAISLDKITFEYLLTQYYVESELTHLLGLKYNF
ncbi:hypothetical protein ACFL2K_01705 [Candidatus Margulisiibacteriota bacterium]